MSWYRIVLAALVPVALVAAAVPHGIASNGGGGAEVVVAVLDTGARGTHNEFAAGQIVAWWDFSTERATTQVLPGPGQTWDARWAPYDVNGHGTATASRVGGKTVSLNPGVKLAIAKVAKDDGSGGAVIEDLDNAYDWAVNTVHADIVSISIGSIVPEPAILVLLDEKISAAMENGTLTVVSGGNGMGNAGGPAVSWTHAYAFSKDAIAVGSLFAGGGANAVVTGSSWQPDIAGEGWDVPAACPASDTCMERTSGTSFAAPHVAGGAAKLLKTAIDAGQDKGPHHLRRLVVSCVADNLWPYLIEGAGFFDADSVARGTPHAAAGTLCPYKVGPQGAAAVSPATQADNTIEGTAARHGKVAMDLWTDGTDSNGFVDAKFILPVAPAITGDDVMGASVPAGAFEVQRYDVTLAKGESYSASVGWALDGVTDIDVYLVPAGLHEPGMYATSLAVAKSAQPADATEALSYTSPAGGAYTLLVVGWSVPLDTPIGVTVSKGGFAGEDVAIGQVLL